MWLSSFGNVKNIESLCIRPDKEKQLIHELSEYSSFPWLARGAGLSYNDACLLQNGIIIDTSRLNHLISFDAESGIAVCQPAVSIGDLFALHPEFIPPVIPGTVHATLAGALAQDIHGKNNHQTGSFGHHVLWFELLINDQILCCSADENSDLFYASIAGLGLTGILLRIAIKLKKASRFVRAEHKKLNAIGDLTQMMSSTGIHHDYQVAWLDLLHSSFRSILTVATYCSNAPYHPRPSHTLKIPSVPFIKKWNMKWFNSLYFQSKDNLEQLHLEEFNNPLDTLKNWNKLYGPKGFLQFQAVFDTHNANDILDALIQLTKKYQATPTLAVLKLLTQSGKGLLSFCKPGFTLAIDFINDSHAQDAIKAMNQLISTVGGRIYLAKDYLLTSEQFQSMYEHYDLYSKILKHYQCPMNSDLAKRLRMVL